MKKSGFYVVRLDKQFRFQIAYFSGLFWYVCGDSKAYSENDFAEIKNYIDIPLGEL